MLTGLTVTVSASVLAVGGLDAVPWYRRLTVTLTAAALVFAAAVIVLLALPPANRFYRAARPPRPPVPVPRPRGYPGPLSPYPRYPPPADRPTAGPPDP